MINPITFAWEGTDNPNDPHGVARFGCDGIEVSFVLNDFATASKLSHLLKSAYQRGRSDTALARPEPEVLARVHFAKTEFNFPSDVVLRQYCDDWFYGEQRDEVDPVDLCRGAIKLFSQTPDPIPVSERLPGTEDCDEKGRCWAWNPEAFWWDLCQLKFIKMNANDPFTHWLPIWALPVPTSQEIPDA